MGELRCKECWEMYKSKISYSAFQKIWEGITWKSIMPEIYTEEMKQLHFLQKSNPGIKNGNSIYTDEEVLKIRMYYVDHTLEETFAKFGKSNSINGFRSMLTRSYDYLPKYSKVKKLWLLKKQVIDINEYKPVSTISESGE